MNKRTKLVTVAVALLVLDAGIARAQEATLTYKWNKGETLRYRIKQTTETTMSGLPGGLPDARMDQVADQVFTMTVEDIAADGNVTLRQSFESMRMDISTPNGKFSIDGAKPSASGAPPEQAVQKVFAAMLNEPFTIVLTPSGRVVKVEGFTRLMDRMFAAMPSDPQAASALTQMRTGLSDEQMTATFSQGFTELPAKPLKTGDAWTTSGTVPNPVFGPTIMSSSLTLMSLDAQVAKIAAKVKMERDPKGTPPPGPMGLKTDMGVADGETETLFDVAKGRLQRATTTITVPMSMSGTGPDGSTLNMKTTAKSTVTVELIEK
jgi:uncharacterized protein DUF6263